jgi:hypothetical protein
MSILDSVLENTQNNINNAVINNTLSSDSATYVPAPQFKKEVHQNYARQESQILDIETHVLRSEKYGDIDHIKGIYCDGKCIQTVSNSYEVHQPKEIAQQFKNVADTHNLDVKKCLFNSKNGGLLISAKYEGTKIAGENHDLSVTFYTSHCGRYRTILSLSALRIACFNQVPLLVKGKQNHLFAEKHYKNALDIDNFGTLLAKIPKLTDSHNDRAMRLKEGKLSFTDFVELCAEQWKQDITSKRWDKKVRKVRDAYYSGTGQQILENDTAYKAYNTITFLNTHDLRNSEYREENIITKSAKESLEFEQVLLENCS